MCHFVNLVGNLWSFTIHLYHIHRGPPAADPLQRLQWAEVEPLKGWITVSDPTKIFTSKPHYWVIPRNPCKRTHLSLWIWWCQSNRAGRKIRQWNASNCSSVPLPGHYVDPIVAAASIWSDLEEDCKVPWQTRMKTFTARVWGPRYETLQNPLLNFRVPFWVGTSTRLPKPKYLSAVQLLISAKRNHSQFIF